MKNVWLLVLACICMTACRNRQQSAEVTNYDLPQIKDSGELVVLTLNSSTSYFDYRGEPMGFQYELADQFARSLDVKLKIKVAQNARDLVHKLLQGEGDLIAYNLPVTKEFKDSVEFCGEDIITHHAESPVGEVFSAAVAVDERTVATLLLIAGALAGMVADAGARPHVVHGPYHGFA